MDFSKKKSDANEDFMLFNNFGGNNNADVENDDLNVNEIYQIGTNIEIEKENKKENLNKKSNKNKTKKSKSTQLVKISTEINTYKAIKEKTIENTNLLELDNKGITLNKLIDEEVNKINNNIQNEDNNNIINEINEINENEEINEINEIKELKDKNSSSCDEEEEEDDEIKKQRIEAIEKITKRTDEIVFIPNFNIFDYSQIIQDEEK